VQKGCEKEIAAACVAAIAVKKHLGEGRIMYLMETFDQ
jgi:hypothetical protein